MRAAAVQPVHWLYGAREDNAKTRPGAGGRPTELAGAQHRCNAGHPTWSPTSAGTVQSLDSRSTAGETGTIDQLLGTRARCASRILDRLPTGTEQEDRGSETGGRGRAWRHSGYPNLRSRHGEVGAGRSHKSPITPQHKGGRAKSVRSPSRSGTNIWRTEGLGAVAVISSSPDWPPPVGPPSPPRDLPSSSS